MRARIMAVALVAACFTVGFAACKDNTVNQTSNTTNNFTSIGPTGGFVEGPDSTRVDVPAGALSAPVDMGIVVAAPTEYPAAPAGWSPVGKVYAFHPHGQFFLVDATIRMPAAEGNFDVWRSEPGGAWALFAKTKASGGFVRFRSSTFSFYALSAGTGGCVRDLDCDAGQTCGAAGTCVGSVDAGGESGVDANADSGDAASDSGDATILDSASDADTGVCPRTPPVGTPGTATASHTGGGPAVPTTDVAATNSSGKYTTSGIFWRTLSIQLTDFANVCGFMSDNLTKGGATFFQLDLRRRSAVALPADFAPGTYTVGDTYADAGVYDESAGVAFVKAPTDCSMFGVPAGWGGTITISTISATEVVGSFNVTFEAKTYTGNFTAPICNPTPGPSCCIGP